MATLSHTKYGTLSSFYTKQTSMHQQIDPHVATSTDKQLHPNFQRQLRLGWSINIIQTQRKTQPNTSVQQRNDKERGQSAVTYFPAEAGMVL